MSKQLNTPVLFIIFNRPETTKRVFKEIEKARPKKLFIAADGPRNRIDEDALKCIESRKIVENIHWPCEVKTLFRDSNVGCKKAVSSAITWFFENVDEGIILEDDCLPDITFFKYCEELLNKYRDNESIMHIGGNNFQGAYFAYPNSYYFSIYNHIWGWATWKRAWKKYDVEMKDYPIFKKNNFLSNMFTDKRMKHYWESAFETVFYNKLDTWDYQWTYAVWKNGGLSILPTKNLVINIGFGQEGTHTNEMPTILKRTTLQSMPFPLTPPKDITVNKKADTYTFNEFFWNEHPKDKLKRFALMLLPETLKKGLKKRIYGLES
jgi:hypothetical protein